MFQTLRHRLTAVMLVGLFCSVTTVTATGGEPLVYQVKQKSQRLEMVTNSSRILSLGKQVPRAMVDNTEVVQAQPLSPTQVQIRALKPGVTTVNLWDEEGEVYSVDVVIFQDASELKLVLETQFPDASIHVRPLANSVILAGTVDRPEHVSQIVTIAKDYYPNVINSIQVTGVQQVLLHVEVMEVSRTKLRQLGFDWANFGNTDSFIQSVSGAIGAATFGGTATGSGQETLAFSLIGPGNQFFGFVDALREYNLVKVLAEPKLVTVSGRPARFLVGGEFPVLVPQGLGTVAIEYKEFGTMVDFVPIVQGNGNIRLEVRPVVSEVDNARGVTLNGTRIPGLRIRAVDTGVEMKAGQTLALAGLIQTRTEAQNRGLPWLADLPWVGAGFRRVQEVNNEIELLIMVRPELVDAMEPHEVPACGPGESTTSPRDVELYFRGYLEVPKCCPDGSCPNCQNGGGGHAIHPGAAGHVVPMENSIPYPTNPAVDGGISPIHSSPLPAANPPSIGVPGVSIPPIGTPSASRTKPGIIKTAGRRTNTRWGFKPNNQQNAKATTPANFNKTARGGDFDPGLFGDVGYDVLDK